MAWEGMKEVFLFRLLISIDIASSTSCFLFPLFLVQIVIDPVMEYWPC